MNKLFTKTFWVKALQLSLAAGVAGFVGYWANSGKAISVSDLKGAAIAFGVGAVGAFIKQVGAVEALNEVATKQAAVDAALAAANPKP